MTTVLVTLMTGSEVLRFNHEPGTDELERIKQSYLRAGFDVVNVRLVEQLTLRR